MTAAIWEATKLTVVWLFAGLRQQPLQYRGMRDWEDESERIDTGNNEHQEQLERLEWILALPDDDTDSFAS